MGSTCRRAQLHHHVLHQCLQQATELYLCDRHSFRMNLQRFLPSEMSPETPMPKWSSILKSFLWKVPISADVRFIDARTICVALCSSQPSAQAPRQQHQCQGQTCTNFWNVQALI